MDDVLKANLMKELGLDRLPEEEQERALLRIGDIIFKKVLIRVLDSMPESKQNELSSYLEKAGKQDTDALYEYLKQNVPDLDRIVEEETAAFKRDALEAMK